MLSYLGLDQAAIRIEKAVKQALFRKKIILLPNGATQSGTQAVTGAVINYL